MDFSSIDRIGAMIQTSEVFPLADGFPCLGVMREMESSSLWSETSEVSR